METVGAIVEQLERLAPLSLAADWDNVGLLLGDRGAEVRRIMTCLTVTPQTVAEALHRQAHLIVTHHPIFFKPLRRLTADRPEEAMLLSLARAGVAVYSAHSAYDNTTGGINEELARRLGLIEVQPLRPVSSSAKQLKLVVFVPADDLQRVSDAVFAAGAGCIGEYRECSYRLQGTGTFFGSEATNPTVGKKGQREEVPEVRLEVVCPESRVAQVVAAMRQAHSYEEPAFDLYPLVSPPGKLGEGRVGQLLTPQTLAELAGHLRQSLRCGPVQVVGDLNKPVQRIAIACGAAGELLADALTTKADVFLSGEMRYHDYLHAQTQGIGLILPGHYASERLGIEVLARQLAQRWPQIEVWASERESDPVNWI